MDSFSDYMDMYTAHQMLIRRLGAGSAFSNPSMFPTFTDVIYNGRLVYTRRLNSHAKKPLSEGKFIRLHE